MDNDDQIKGQILSRREALKLIGMLSAAALVGCQPSEATTSAPTAALDQAPASTSGGVTAAATTAQGAEASPTTGAAVAPTNGSASTQASSLPACIVRPELTEGPFFVDERLNRSDIRPDPSSGAVSEGTPLKIIVRASRIDSTACAIFPGVTVDVWHCDAAGVYSDVQNAVGQQFLRGYQVTNENGVAEFTTVYPGWYPGRAVHIHFKLRTNPDGSGEEFTSQWFFDESLTDVVHANQPYAARGYRTTFNQNDGIFREAGDQMILQVTQEADGSYTATFDVGLQMS